LGECSDSKCGLAAKTEWEARLSEELAVLD